MWKHVDTVTYYISDDFKFSPSIAIFSFIGTIVKKVDLATAQPKYTFPEAILKEKMESIGAASIIVYDSFNTTNLTSIKTAFEQFQKLIGCPMIAFFSTARNKYSKPFTGVWKLIELLYKKHEKTINKPSSLIIGNRAGRVTIKQIKKDRDCTDRAFANNISISFVTPEKFFLNDNKLSLWAWDTILNKKAREKLVADNKSVPIILDEIKLLPKSDKYTIIITGPPSCGKTTLAKKIKRKWDAENGIIEIVGETDINKAPSVIIETQNLTNIIKASMEKLAPILIIEIQCDEYISQLIDFMKVQTQNSILKPKTYFAQYKFRRPKNIYENIPCVRYVKFPLVLQSCEELWFEYSY